MNNLTILIPTRNRPEYLREALLSVKTAFGTEPTILLGDNGNCELTAAMLTQNLDFGLRIEHFRNPAGATYVYNLHRLVSSAQTEWLSILHDDDFFVGKAGLEVAPLLRRTDVDFIFSDHWMASWTGQLDERRSLSNSFRYGRTALVPGRQDDLALSAACQKICLDGFFVRTRLAQEIPFDLSLQIFADILWLTSVCDRANSRGWYVPQRLFAYRVSQLSLTTKGMDLAEITLALSKLRLQSPAARRAVWLRIRKLKYQALRSRIKRMMIRILPGRTRALPKSAA